ncbi:MAG: hypothetical protein KBT45_06300 [Bacteroidales bacterium]|nr:hypothetical protein [Candidatus Colimorpha pelethequi]
MKFRFLSLTLLLLLSLGATAQQMHSSNALLDSAFRLAVWTIDHNTHDGIIHAGGGYGGEWTRDCAINSWNALSLLRPEVAEKSLWSVTENGARIGHQYWDKIIWVIAAYNHYQTTGDTVFLRKAYRCSRTTMEELERLCFDSTYGLFMGPAVFQDGIAGYDEPVYDPAKWDDSYVLHHPHSDSTRCLSTNAVYYRAYCCLDMMARILEEPPAISVSFLEKALRLAKNIEKHFYRPDCHKFYYLIDHKGAPHDYQEGLGVAFALLFNLVPVDESLEVIANTYVTAHGIPCVYPSFPRNTPDKPGRHNLMIWPHINGFYGSACASQGAWKSFYFELESMADLAVNRGKGDFYEIYTVDGEPSGGWQCGALWDIKEHQTWCATGFLRMVLNHVFGIEPFAGGLMLTPHGMQDGSTVRLENLHYRDANLTIEVNGCGDKIKSCDIQNLQETVRIPQEHCRHLVIPSILKGEVLVRITLE